MPKSTTTQFTVEGNGRFPLDMLRYDSCWPAAQADVRSIDDIGSRREIILVTASPNAPTAERWHSFGWKVLP